MARAAPPHGVVRLGQRRRVVHERRERSADAEVADRRALAEARARVRARRRGALVGFACVGLASPSTPSTRNIYAIEGRVDAFEGAQNVVDAAPCPGRALT